MKPIVTRSAAALAAAKALRHPQADEAFKEGLGSIMRQWTALELAVFHQWGGDSSQERASHLVEDMYNMFAGPEKIYKDDISMFLEDYLEANFNTICEDGSPEELGELLVMMWRQCCDGDFTLVTNALGREFTRHEQQTISKCSGLSNTGDAMDSDDEISGDANMEENQMDMDDIGKNAQREASTAPAVDPDGWETVARGKSKSKK